MVFSSSHDVANDVKWVRVRALSDPERFDAGSIQNLLRNRRRAACCLNQTTPIPPKTCFDDWSLRNVRMCMWGLVM